MTFLYEAVVVHAFLFWMGLNPMDFVKMSRFDGTTDMGFSMCVFLLDHKLLDL